MPFRRNHKKEKKRSTIEVGMEDIVSFVRIISACAGALLLISITAFLLTGRGQETNVIYALVIGFNAVVFLFGTLFVKKFEEKED